MSKQQNASQGLPTQDKTKTTPPPPPPANSEGVPLASRSPGPAYPEPSGEDAEGGAVCMSDDEVNAPDRSEDLKVMEELSKPLKDS